MRSTNAQPIMEIVPKYATTLLEAFCALVAWGMYWILMEEHAMTLMSVQQTTETALKFAQTPLEATIALAWLATH